MCLNIGSNWGQYTCLFLREQLEFIKTTAKHLRKINIKYDGHDFGSYIFFFWIFTEQKWPLKAPRKGCKFEKKQVGWILGLSLGGIEPCIQFTSLCEVFFTRLDQKTRMSSRAGCYITQLDSSHSLIHFSAYLYPFKSRDLTTPPPSRAGTHTRLVNNGRKDAARLLRENEWRSMSCVEDFREWDLDQSSTCCWHSLVGGKKTLWKRKWSWH